MSSFTFGNNVGLTLTHDNDGRVTDIDAAGAGTTVQDLSFGYDLASNITARIRRQVIGMHPKSETR